MRQSVLLRIRRQFTESEAVKFLQNELSKSDFKIGELVSEIAEHKHTINTQKVELARLNKCLHEKGKEFLKQEVGSCQFKKMNELLMKKSAEIRKLKQDIDLLHSRNLAIK